MFSMHRTMVPMTSKMFISCRVKKQAAKVGIPEFSDHELCLGHIKDSVKNVACKITLNSMFSL